MPMLQRAGEDNFLMPGAVRPEDVADALVEAMREE